ncbi:Alpha/beta hydrolase fold-1 [Thelonectria olida]|uniref:Alpha/beta hydrolase fold-1 n=1 Tax=Thelonectria olida TaxID=1576542 RepID=A0A9P9AUR9_9HYPO|nr:Alpha/beta hydrolase fold-1 [Thelonectria olida]
MLSIFKSNSPPQFSSSQPLSIFQSPLSLYFQVMSSNPTIVFVPGAWHGPETWDALTAVLEEHQLKCVSVALPTTSGNPESTFSEDVNAVRDAIVAETTQGRDVVVVVHSFGGAVGSSALKGLTKPKGAEPPSEGDASGHVIGFFMIATGFIVSGLTFMQMLRGTPPPSWKENTETGFADIVIDPREMFYHDLPEEEGKLWVSRLRKQSMKAFTTDAEYSYAGWAEVPVWYLATKQDYTHPYEVQKMFADDARAKGSDVTFREIETSHSPMLSRPTETAEIIMEAVAAFKA